MPPLVSTVIPDFYTFKASTCVKCQVSFAEIYTHTADENVEEGISMWFHTEGQSHAPSGGPHGALIQKEKLYSSQQGEKYILDQV